jgi:hypothetical protein
VSDVNHEESTNNHEESDKPMKIKLTSVYVDDQEKALRFDAEVLGFAKKSSLAGGRNDMSGWRGGR